MLREVLALRLQEREIKVVNENPKFGFAMRMRKIDNKEIRKLKDQDTCMKAYIMQR